MRVYDAVMAREPRVPNVIANRAKWVIHAVTTSTGARAMAASQIHDVWLPMRRTMSEYTTVIAYSRAGFGRSDADPPDHSVTNARFTTSGFSARATAFT